MSNWFSYKDYSPLMIGSIAIILFITTTVLFQPGELDLTGPVHTDFYDYFIISQGKWIADSWLTPRPLMRGYLKIFGILSQPDILFVLLALPTLCFLTVLPYSIIKFNLTKKSILTLIAFFLVILGSPFFSIHFQWDFGGMLSGFFATLAIFEGYRILENKEYNSDFWWFWALFFTLISIECKPTYSFTLLAAAIIGAIFIKGKYSKILLLGVAGIFIWVFLKDKYLGPSTFLASADSNSPYAIVISPLKNLEMIAFYMKNAFTFPLSVITFLSASVLVIFRRWKILGVLVVLTVSATSPLALLVNRPQDTYSIFSTIVIGVIVMIAVSELLVHFNDNSHKNSRFYSLGVILLIFIGLIFHLFSSNTTTEWLLTQKKYNHNVISSLKMINEFNERKILFAGLKGPFHPFRNTGFVEKAYPMIGRFDVLLNKNEIELNKTYTEQRNAIYIDNLRWSDYSKIYVFDENGKVSGVFNSDEITKMSTTSRSLLFCGGVSEAEVLKDVSTILKTIDCLNDNQEYPATIEIATSALSVGKNSPWIYFILAKAYNSQGNLAKALDSINKALEIEPSNAKFLSELKEIQDKNLPTK